MAAPGACEPWTFKNIRGDLYRISPGVPRHLTHESHGWGKVTRAGEPVSCAAAGTVRAPAWVCAHPNFTALGAGCWVPGTTFVCGGCSLCGPATGTPAAPPGATPVVSPLHYSAASASHTPRDQMAAGDVLLSPLAGSHHGFSSSSLRSCDSWVLGAAGPLLPPAAPWQSWHRGANSRKELIKPMCN